MEAGLFSMEGTSLINRIVDANPDCTKGIMFEIELPAYNSIKIENATLTQFASSRGSVMYIVMKDEPEDRPFEFRNLSFDGSIREENTHSNSNGQSHSFVIETALTDYVAAHGELWPSLLNHRDYPEKAF